MGMFDYLQCEMPLPVEWQAERGWQTKDLDCAMERYTITSDGRLIHHAVRYEDVPEAERPCPNAEPGTWESICGVNRSVPIGDVETPFHGDLEFHDYDRERGWLSITARFTEGRVVRMWHEWKPPYDRPDAVPPAALVSENHHEL